MVAGRRRKLAPVRQFADREADAAAADLARATGELNAACQLLDELEAYRAGYLTRASLQNQWRATHWMDYHNFLQRLDTAIRAQKDIIEHREAQLNAVRRVWQAKKSRCRSLDQLDEKLLSRERSIADQLAQKEADARALMTRQPPGPSD